MTSVPGLIGLSAETMSGMYYIVSHFVSTVNTFNYYVRGSYCAGDCTSFSCDKPNQVIWVDPGVNWGVRPEGTPANETCLTRPTDCIINQQNSQFIQVKTLHCPLPESTAFHLGRCYILLRCLAILINGPPKPVGC